LFGNVAGNYRGAAEMFLEVGTDIEGIYTDVLTVRDVAVYGAMAALASFTRAELKSRYGIPP
jgi:COP9 signalosome complex subunit 1